MKNFWTVLTVLALMLNMGAAKLWAEDAKEDAPIEAAQQTEALSAEPVVDVDKSAEAAPVVKNADAIIADEEKKKEGISASVTEAAAPAVEKVS